MGSDHVRWRVRATQSAVGVSFQVVILGIGVSPSQAACMPGALVLPSSPIKHKGCRLSAAITAGSPASRSGQDRWRLKL